MPLIQENFDSLPYIDTDLTNAQRAEINDLLASSLPPDHASTLHPSIPITYTPQFSPLVAASHVSIATTGKPRDPTTGIDPSRYSEPSAPSAPSDISAWRTTLSAAYTSQQYLRGRAENLDLLERHGRNAWLIGNSQAEEMLRALEKEVKEGREQQERLEAERRARQEGVRGEIEGLERTWREGLGRAIEAEVAGEGLKGEILEAQKNGGG